MSRHPRADRIAVRVPSADVERLRAHAPDLDADELGDLAGRLIAEVLAERENTSVGGAHVAVKVPITMAERAARILGAEAHAIAFAIGVAELDRIHERATSEGKSLRDALARAATRYRNCVS